MSISQQLIQFYFDYVYNPVYDFTTGRLNCYRQLQDNCISKLEIDRNARILCAGLGTGNEIISISEKSKEAKIVGIDFSHSALKKAYKKSSLITNTVDLKLMDVRSLKFPSGSFDVVLCIHVLDFIKEHEVVTGELLRVLKEGGQFVITFPSDGENPRLGINLLRGGMSLASNPEKHRIRNTFGFATRMLVGMVYVPLLLRPKLKHYSLAELRALVSKFTNDYFQIEEFRDYQDFIAYGRKLTSGGK